MDEASLKALVSAQGVALATLSVLLHRAGVLDVGAFARALGLQATVTLATDRAEGDILGVWAAYLDDAADTVANVGQEQCGQASQAH